MSQVTRQCILPASFFKALCQGEAAHTGSGPLCSLKAGMAQPSSREHEAEERLPSPLLCCISADRWSAGQVPRRCCENKVT